MESMSELHPLLRDLKAERKEMSGDRNSGCRSSAAMGGSSGGRNSSCGKGGSGARNLPKACKKAGWEDAGLEFYREAYPGALENLYDSRLRTLLPSKRYSIGTLGRETYRRRASTRSNRRFPGSAATTLVHTNRRGSDTYLEVLPDLTQGVDEEETWVQLQQIRLHAVSMDEKRELKKQLLSAPTLRTRGLAAVHLSRRKLISRMKVRLREMISKIELWHSSLRYVEGNFGTGLVAFFTFIKWLLFLNFFSSILIILFIIIPQMKFTNPEDWCSPHNNHSASLLSLSSLIPFKEQNPTLPPSSPASLSSPSSPISSSSIQSVGVSVLSSFSPHSPSPSFSPLVSSFESLDEFQYENETSVCCYEQYKEGVQKRQENNPFIIQIVLDCLQGTGILEISQLFYGFYPKAIYSIEELNGWHYRLPLAYLSVMVAILTLSLIFMVRKAARGLRERLRSSEGQFYQFSNLIFGGWDHCIENSKAASIKKKAVYNELRNFLETEKYKEEKRQRKRKEKCRLYIVRLFINLLVLIILAAAFTAIYKATIFAFLQLISLQGDQYWTKGRSARRFSNASNEEGEAGENEIPWWSTLLFEYLPVGTIVSLNVIIPYLFKILVKFERYTPNFILSITLFRTVFLRLASLVVLLFTVYQRIKACEPLAGECENSKCSEQFQCWETYVGQQLYKLIILDLLLMIINTFFINFPRKILGHRLLRGTRVGELIGSIEFEIPKHVLDVVYGQTLCWLGMFYAPLLPAITCIKLVIVYYVKYFDCSVNTTQSSQLYRTSRSNSLFIAILLISFVVTIIPVGFSIAELKPSSSCGPFHDLPSIWNEIVIVIEESPKWLQDFLFFLGTAGFAVPAIIILILILYYFYAVAAANKHMVCLLKHQLILEGHDKQFLLSRLEKAVNRARELEELQRSEMSSELPDFGTVGNNDLTLDIRGGGD